MQCPACGTEMKPLLLSEFCPKCESGGEKDGGLHQGFIVWRERPNGATEYVFQTREGAEQWRAAAGLRQFPIRPVASDKPFRWHVSNGTCTDLILAEGVYEIHHSEAEYSPRTRGAWLVEST